MIDLDHISFTEWLVELNSYARDAGYREKLLVDQTGTICWFSYYLEGTDPKEALQMAEQDGMEFGSDYQFTG